MSYFIDPNVVPGRLGLLATLDLIFANVYNSVEGPKSRGFSYIEVWMVGLQIPIVVGILEYAVLLAMKRYKKSSNIIQVKQPKSPIDQNNTFSANFDVFSRTIDKWAFVGCSIYILTFIICYWMFVVFI